MKNNSIPVLYYHSIADHEANTIWSFLSVRIEVFKSQIQYLKKNGYNTCNWSDAYEHIIGDKRLPEKTIMIQFDDGFLDNWSVVYPIMAEVGFKYTVLLSPEFIQKGEARTFVKKTFEYNKSEWWGYLNEDEIHKMSSSGLVDFQAHGFTHTWYESSDNIVDICGYDQIYPHIQWNKYPDNKPYWLNQKMFVDEGYPVFENEKSIRLKKRFIIDDKFIEESKQIYRKFEDKKTNMENINIFKRKYINKNGAVGRYETSEEESTRLYRELYEAKVFISNITKKPVDFMVFPGGAYTDDVIILAKKYGYKMVSKGSELNKYRSNVYQLNRVSGSYGLSNLLYKSMDLFFLRLQIERGSGNIIIAKFFKFIKKC